VQRAKPALKVRVGSMERRDLLDRPALKVCADSTERRGQPDCKGRLVLKGCKVRAGSTDRPVRRGRKARLDHLVLKDCRGRRVSTARKVRADSTARRCSSAEPTTVRAWCVRWALSGRLGPRECKARQDRLVSEASMDRMVHQDPWARKDRSD
jgi:hypothetical protein